MCFRTASVGPARLIAIERTTFGAAVPSAQPPDIRPRSFPVCAVGATRARAEIPAFSGEVALARTAGALSNVGEVRRVPEVAVDGRKLGLGGLRKPARGIDDAGPHRCCDTGAANNAPTAAIGDVIDPNASIGVRDRCDVGRCRAFRRRRRRDRRRSRSRAFLRSSPRPAFRHHASVATSLASVLFDRSYSIENGKSGNNAFTSVLVDTGLLRNSLNPANAARLR